MDGNAKNCIIEYSLLDDQKLYIIENKKAMDVHGTAYIARKEIVKRPSATDVSILFVDFSFRSIGQFIIIFGTNCKNIVLPYVNIKLK